jgi:hypothetical protein
MWRVNYDDGDREDYSARELAGVLISTESESGRGRWLGQNEFQLRQRKRLKHGHLAERSARIIIVVK